MIQRQEEAEASSILNSLRADHTNAIDQLSDEDFEEYVKMTLDHMMESLGWPEDRRPFVENDIRKMRIFAKERANFCKHLIPLQDLRHTQHPATVYAEETDYTISCELLHKRTQIGVTDMELALKAMKSTHCDDCQYRVPGQRSGVPDS